MGFIPLSEIKNKKTITLIDSLIKIQVSSIKFFIENYVVINQEKKVIKFDEPNVNLVNNIVISVDSVMGVL